MAGLKISNEVGATVFAILSGIAVICFGAWAFLSGGCQDRSEPIAPLPADSAVPAPLPALEIDRNTGDLEAELAKANADLELESSRRAELAIKLRESESKLKAALSSASAPAVDKSAGLKSKITSLTDELAALKAALTTSEEAKVALEADLAKLKTENEGLNGKLKAAGSLDSETEALKAEIAELKATLKAEAEACTAAKKKLEAEISKLKAKIKELTTAAKAAVVVPEAPAAPKLNLPLLVEKPSELPADFANLFEALGKVDAGPEQREKIYSELKASGKLLDIHRVPFDVGSSKVASAESATLEKLLTDTPKKERFLVVGYASTDGDAESNRELSSARASAVAAEVAKFSGVAEESVKAVYFGQTKRFNLNYLSPNRVVEVWRLK